MSRAPITTVLFDLSEVLLTGMFGTAQRLTPLVPHSPLEIDRQLKIPAWQHFQTGHIFEDQYWSAVRRAAGWNLPNEFLAQTVRQNFREIEAVRPQIVDLRRRGYRVGLVSNHTREWVDWLERQFQFHELFDDLVFSCHVGMAKPDRGMYALALRRLRASPESTLVIDDDAENLLSANALGCRVLQFITAHQLAHDLRRLKVTT